MALIGVVVLALVALVASLAALAHNAPAATPAAAAGRSVYLNWPAWAGTVAKLERPGQASTLVILGDSISEGIGASVPGTLGWPALFADALHTAHGAQVEPGFVGLWRAGARKGTTAWTMSGSWAPDPSQYAVVGQPGATASFGFVGVGIRIVAVAPAGTGALDVRVDGSPRTPTPARPARGPWSFGVGSLSSGRHTLTLTVRDGPVSVSGAEPVPAHQPDVVIDNLSLQGGGTARLRTDESMALVDAIVGHVPDVVIFATYTNDYAAQTPLPWYQVAVAHVVSFCPPQRCRLLLLATGPRRGDFGSGPDPYVGVLRSLAIGTGVPMLDVLAAHEGDAGYLTSFLADAVHPNDQGHRDIADRLVEP